MLRFGSFKVTKRKLIIAVNRVMLHLHLHLKLPFNNYQFIQYIKHKRCIFPYENHYWKLLFRVHLLRIFIRLSLSTPTKWKIFLVPLWIVFSFSFFLSFFFFWFLFWFFLVKLKTRLCRMVFFLMKMLYIERMVQL